MKKFTEKVKVQFIGKSKTEAIEMLKEMAEDYEIKTIDYFENTHKVPKSIFINRGRMWLRFDKTTRRISEVW